MTWRERNKGTQSHCSCFKFWNLLNRYLLLSLNDEVEHILNWASYFFIVLGSQKTNSTTCRKNRLKVFLKNFSRKIGKLLEKLCVGVTFYLSCKLKFGNCPKSYSVEYLSEVYLEPCETSMVELFYKKPPL